MIKIRNVNSNEKQLVNEIVTIHLKTFTGFFLTFMGRGFLNQMYQSYCEHPESGLLIAEEEGKAVGFLAYSNNFSGLYKYMIKVRIFQFALYSAGAFFRRPSAFFRIIKAFLKPKEAKRQESYVELSSIGVVPDYMSKGIGSMLVDKLKDLTDYTEFSYIALETDAKNNDATIRFYEKNGFVRERIFETDEGRKMYEYRFYET